MTSELAAPAAPSAAGRSLRRLGDVAASPVVASLLLAFVLAGLAMWLTGASPLDAYREMWNGAVTGNGPRTTINRAIPIVGMALAISIPFRAGIIHIGAEGSMIVGGLASAVVAIETTGPAWIVVPISLAVGAAAGVAWAMIPALAQTRLQLPILISGLLLNTPARALTAWLTKNPFADPAATSTATRQIPADARIPSLGLVGGASASALVVLALVVVIALVNSRTAPGYQTLISGLNTRFARAGGVAVERQVLITMAIGGAIAGAVGGHLVLGQAFRFVDGDLPGTGFAWTGLLVCLLATSRPVPILVAGTFFAALQVGGAAMQRNAGVSSQVAQVLQAIVILALALQISFSWRRRRGASARSVAH